MLKEDTEMINLLSPAVKLIPNLVTTVEEKLQENLPKVRFEELPDQHCNVVCFHVGTMSDETNT